MQRIMVVWLVGAVWLIACNPKDCLKSTGKILKKNYVVAFFNKLYVYDNISVILQNSDSVFVEAGEKLMDRISLEVSADSTLHIRNRNECNFLRSYDIPVKVYIGVRHLDYIQWRSFGTLQSDGQINFSHLQMDFMETNPTVRLNTDALGIYMFCNSGADIRLEGKTTFLGFYHLGYGRVEASDLQAENAHIINEGQNNIYVKVSDFLKAEIRHSGNIIIRQPPRRQEVTITGTGKVLYQPY